VAVVTCRRRLRARRALGERGPVVPVAAACQAIETATETWLPLDRDPNEAATCAGGIEDTVTVAGRVNGEPIGRSYDTCTMKMAGPLAKLLGVPVER
jgi:hypothetical protein